MRIFLREYFYVLPINKLHQYITCFLFGIEIVVKYPYNIFMIYLMKYFYFIHKVTKKQLLMFFIVGRVFFTYEGFIDYFIFQKNRFSCSSLSNFIKKNKIFCSNKLYN